MLSVLAFVFLEGDFEAVTTGASLSSSSSENELNSKSSTLIVELFVIADFDIFGLFCLARIVKQGWYALATSVLEQL